MIFTLIIEAFIALITLVLSILPTWSPVDFSSFTTTASNLFTRSEVGNGLTFFNNFVPMDQVVIILGLTFTLWAGAIIYRVSVWALTKVHVLGGNSD